MPRPAKRQYVINGVPCKALPAKLIYQKLERKQVYALDRFFKKTTVFDGYSYHKPLFGSEKELASFITTIIKDSAVASAKPETFEDIRMHYRVSHTYILEITIWDREAGTTQHVIVNITADW